MRFGLWQRQSASRLGGPAGAPRHFLDRWVSLLEITTPDTPQLLRRITRMERDIILPIKAAGVAMLLYSFYSRHEWYGQILSALEISVETTRYFLWIYIAANMLVVGLLASMRRLPLGLVQWIVFAISLVDGIFLSVLTLVTGGYDSPLYWLFLGLIVRSAVSVPRATSQLLLNLTLSACYVLAGVINLSLAEYVAEYLSEEAREAMKFSGPLDNSAESLLLRLALLLLMTLCCYGVQVLLDRQRQAVEEAREFALREGQLRSAGRMAAEFVHQVKNPLAIIHNAAFCLQRALNNGRGNPLEQVRIIQEEVERSDRIITQIMGYAQLSEGRVEKLDFVEELDHAIQRVFPPAAGYPIRVHRDYAGKFPPLLMQRRHVSDALINLLQNAREALDGQEGNVFVRARCHPDYSIEVAIRDDGPGIPADKQEKIFEAYYTTKAKGTGLGLATVKHNLELYGGTVRVESELGKGACFVLVFPARTPIRMAL